MNRSVDLVRARQRRKEARPPAKADPSEMLQAVAASDPTPERLAFSRQVQQKVAAALDELAFIEEILTR